MSYLRKPDGQKCGKFCSSSEDSTPKLKKKHHLMPTSPAFMPLEEGEGRAYMLKLCNKGAEMLNLASRLVICPASS